ncbi:MAG: type II toxin-antitoxin system VapC family toxin [Pseudomonadota bacterium]|nr:type II toxin-antitoxin system VapC family toxin [Pseudomonadota bacterium]MEA3240631.1 type II toxin-antitoxin system VapC family toxin [Pseudomonadota bacterium]
MIAFLDTSALVKLYHTEDSTREVEKVISQVEEIYLSGIAELEFRSTIWKKVRTNEIDKVSAKVVMDAFEDDFNKYSWVEIDFDAIQLSKDLLMRYGQKGLRTLDSIQLSSAVVLKNNNCQFVTFDLRLRGFFRDEGLSVFE